MSTRPASVFGRLLDTVRENCLLESGDRVLVAVSGGADSVALLDLLCSARRRLALGLVAFHMNHGLRPDSRRDEEFVRGLARRYDVRVAVVRSDVSGYARRRRVGVEEAGRVLRYRNMDRAAAAAGCNKIALGHTANDNLETMLMNLIRGAGTHGLAGIPVRRGKYIRPLLDLERVELERHLSAVGLPWVEDESNRDIAMRRNLLRHQVVPILRALSPAVFASARRTARLVADDDQLLENLAARARRSVVRRCRRRIVVDTRLLGEYNEALKRRIIKQLVPGLDSGAVERVLQLCRAGGSAGLSLTDEIRVCLKKSTMEFTGL